MVLRVRGKRYQVECSILEMKAAAQIKYMIFSIHDFYAISECLPHPQSSTQHISDQIRIRTSSAVKSRTILARL